MFAAAPAADLAHVERVLLEHDQGRIAPACLEALQVAVFQDQERAIVVLQDCAALGDDRDTLLRIAPVVDENSDQQPLGLPFAHPQGEVALDLDEFAGLQHVAEHVGRNLALPGLEPAQAVRGHVSRDDEDQRGDHRRHEQERPEQLPGLHAGGVHDDDFGVGRKLVQHIGDRHDQGDRRDDENEIGDGKPGQPDEDQHGLSLAGHHVDAAQRLRDPDDRGQRDQHKDERRKRLTENIAVD